MRKTLLTIGGFDPTAGAGINLDLKIFHHMGFMGTAVVTAITAQNTQAGIRIYCLPPDMITDQHRSLQQDIPVSGIKISMFGCQENLSAVLSVLEVNSSLPIVLDPIIRSSTGLPLSPKKTLLEFMTEAREKITVATPNWNEAEALAGRTIHSSQDVDQTAQRLHDRFQIPVLITGYPDSRHRVDTLYDGVCHTRFRNRVRKKRVHGTGCFLSSSLLGYLVQKKSLQEGCRLAVEVTQKAIQRSEKIGQGQNLIILP